MSETRTRANAAAASAPADKAKVKREIGPRDLYVLFKPGTPAEVVEATKAAIGSVTMNGRALLKHLQGGSGQQFISYKVDAEKRSPKEG
jgi:hypothetical protein